MHLSVGFDHEHLTDFLIADIFTSGENLEDVVSQFLANYAQDSPAALTELINTVIKCAGCNIQVTEDDVNDTENVEGRLGDLQEEYQAVGSPSILLIFRSRPASKTSQVIHSSIRERVVKTSEKPWLDFLRNW